MRLGFCASVKNMADVLQEGFDFIELPLAPTVALMAEHGEDTEERETILQMLPRVRNYNILLPGSVNLLSSTSAYELEQYLHQAFELISDDASMEGHPAAVWHPGEQRVIVFGSGRSRNRPADMPYGEAVKILTNRVKLMGLVAGEYNLAIAIEPLNRAETNMIRSLPEAAILAAGVDLPNVGIVADFYHMLKEDEPLDHLSEGYPILHAHIVEGRSRDFPVKMTEELHRFLELFRASGYTGDVSIESFNEFTVETLRACLAAVRPALA